MSSSNLLTTVTRVEACADFYADIRDTIRALRREYQEALTDLEFARTRISELEAENLALLRAADGDQP